MYYSNLIFRNKHYYSNEDLVQINKINNIKNLIKNTDNIDFNNPLEVIKYGENVRDAINDLKKNNTIINNIDNCDRLELIELIEIKNNRLLDIEYKLNRNNTFMVEGFNTIISTSISPKYILYIQKYGVPNDGIFIEELLQEFI
jgi:hypothetical protein